MKIQRTQTTTVKLTDKEIREALTEYVAVVHGLTGERSVEIYPNTSWEAEGRNMYTASVTFTVTEKADS